MSAFSNGTEWDIWEESHCSACKVDAPFREEKSPTGCDLILAAMCGEKPPEWTSPDPKWPHNYECSKFEPIKESP